MSIKIKIEGFEDLLKEIEKASGDMDRACDSAIRESAQIVQRELTEEMKRSGVDAGLISRMPQPQIFRDGNAFVAKVGYTKDAYNPEDPSDGYKAVFLNFGTPYRSKHGKIKDGVKVKLGWIERAKKNAKPKLKKSQKEVFEKIVERLKK